MERDLAKIKEENPENWFEDVYRMYKDRTNWFNYTDTYSNLIIIGSTRFWDELKFWCSPKAIEKFKILKNFRFKIFESARDFQNSRAPPSVYFLFLSLSEIPADFFKKWTKLTKI